MATRGVEEAARQFNLTAFLEVGVEVFLIGLTRVLAPAAGTNEESAVHAAIADTSDFLFDQYGVDDRGLQSLDSLGEDMIALAMERFVTGFINTRLMHALGSRIEAGAESAEQAAALEAEITEYVRERVVLDLSGSDLMTINWDSPESELVVQQIFEDAYSLMEVAE